MQKQILRHPTPQNDIVTNFNRLLTLFSVELALEVKEYGIAVNAFHPGHVVTEGSAAMRLRRADLYGKHIILNRKVKGDPPEVCDEPIVYLATQTAATFTGQVMHREDYGKTWGPGISPLP